MSYAAFLAQKERVWTGIGVTDGDPPAQLFDWQRAIVKWALRKGRAAIFADCGLGKTFMQVAWAMGLPEKTRVLFMAPLCVAEQTVTEAAKIGAVVRYARNEVEAIGARFVITNYERVDDFDLDNYEAVVLDESSILKALDGKTRKKLIDLCQHVKYRLCCTATPSPNDIAELGNHAEFLGLMKHSEFLATWFVHDDSGWRMKKHAVKPFYRWMASWAIAIRQPSDLGYSDDGFKLPALHIVDHIVGGETQTPYTLFPEMGVKGLSGRLTARRGSLDARVEKTALLALSHAPKCQSIVWCGLNPEADAITEAIGETAVQVAGSDSYESKVAAVNGFTAGQINALVSKVRILGYGMNFQNCHHMMFCGLGDSFEQYYQAIRRCWRFGQKIDVTANIIVSESEQVIVENVRRKEAAARQMSDELVGQMTDFEREEVTA